MRYNSKKIISRKFFIVIALLLIFSGFVVGNAIFQGSLMHISGGIKKANVTVKDITVELGDINSGEEFSITKTYSNSLKIENASRVAILLNLTGLEEEQRAQAFQEGHVNIVIGDRHSNGTWDEYLNVTLDLNNPMEVRGTIEVNGTHQYDIRIKVWGTAGYPEDYAVIDFSIMIAVLPP